MIETAQGLSVTTAVLGTLSVLSLMDAIAKLVTSSSTVVGHASSSTRRTSSNKSSSLVKRLRSIQVPMVISVVCMLSYVFLCSHPILLDKRQLIISSSSSAMIAINLFSQIFYLPPPWTLLYDHNGLSSTLFIMYALALLIILVVGTRHSLFLTDFFKGTASTGASCSTNTSSSSSIKGEDSTMATSSALPTALNTPTDPLSPFNSPEIKLDMMYLASHFLPTSTHYDILFFISTVPSLLIFAKDTMERADQLKKERIEFLKKQKKEKERRQVELTMFDTVLNEGGWADEDDNNNNNAKTNTPIDSVGEESDDNNKTLDSLEAIRQAKEAKIRAEKEKELLAKQVAEVTGKTSLAENLLLEDVDEGVLGQKWVERTLTQVGQWPPICFKKNPSLLQHTFPLEKKNRRHYTTALVTAMDHPAVMRTLCITAGRLNSQMLNTHTELGKSVIFFNVIYCINSVLCVDFYPLEKYSYYSYPFSIYFDFISECK